MRARNVKALIQKHKIIDSRVARQRLREAQSLFRENLELKIAHEIDEFWKTPYLLDIPRVRPLTGFPIINGKPYIKPISIKELRLIYLRKNIKKIEDKLEHQNII